MARGTQNAQMQGPYSPAAPELAEQPWIGCP
jgi:hypothetical protein